MESYQAIAPKAGIDVGPGVAVSFMRCQAEGEHEHTKECVWVWHDCAQILGSDSIMPGARFGWRPSGIEAHTLVSLEPLTISPSLYWPDCCSKHGFITDGVYFDV